MKIYLYSAILILLVSTCIPGITKYPRLLYDDTSEPAKIVISNVSVFTGKDSFLLENQHVLIENGKIVKVSNTPIVSENTINLSGEGKTLLPGFIDAHVHAISTSSPPWKPSIPDEDYNMEAYLFSGVTTIYDMGGPGERLEKLRNKLTKGKVMGPDIYHTHSMITVGGSHPIPSMEEILPSAIKPIIKFLVTRIDKPEDARKIILEARKAKADYIKIVCDQIPVGTPEMPFELMKAIVVEAHKENLKVFVHIGSKGNIFKALEAGVDVLAHGPYKSELTEADARKIASYGKPIVYTLSSFNHLNHLCHGDYQPGQLDSIIVPAKILNSYKGENGKGINTLPAFRNMGELINDNSRFYRKNIEYLHKAGVKILAGTDSPMLGIFPGSSLHNEMEELVENGIPEYLVLKGATSEAAKLFLDNPDFGTIEAGKKANLVLVKGNPLVNICITREIDLVIKNGKIVERRKL